MIDLKSRARYLEDSKTKTLVDGMKESILAAIQTNSKNPSDNEEVLKLVVKREEEKELLNKVDKLGSALALVYQAISKPLSLPKIFQVKGEVSINKGVEVNNLDELDSYFKSLEKTINNLALAIHSVPQPKIDFPKIEFPKSETKVDLTEVIKSLDDLKEVISQAPKDDTSLNTTLKLIQQGISTLVEKPTYAPPAVTKIDINPLRGQFQTTLITVGTTPTPLPANPAIRRRALMIFNEDSSAVVRIGGAAVIASGGNGTKVGLPVLPQTYSPVIDAGPTMILYGIVSSGTVNVTVLEAENDYVSPASPSAGTIVGGVNV